jgi:hypothetical protein
MTTPREPVAPTTSGPTKRPPRFSNLQIVAAALLIDVIGISINTIGVPMGGWVVYATDGIAAVAVGILARRSFTKNREKQTIGTR